MRLPPQSVLAALAALALSSSLAAQTYAFTSFAGNPSYGRVDGTGGAARFSDIRDVAVDSGGNVFVSDTGNAVIRKITPAGVVTTYAGVPGEPGHVDGARATARFRLPYGLAIDAADNLYVADTLNHVIRKITPGGVVSTIAGLATIRGSANGSGSAARFSSPVGIAADTSGNLYVTDASNHTIRRVTAAGDVTTLAGSPGVPGSTNGVGSAARFYIPEGIVVDAAGVAYVADSGNHTIRRIAAEGTVTLLAGSPLDSGFSDATGTFARFDFPARMTLNAAGSLVVADSNNHSIRLVNPSTGATTTMAGFLPGSVDGALNAARFYYPASVKSGPNGSLYIADSENCMVRVIEGGNSVGTLAGYDGNGISDGLRLSAQFFQPIGLAADAAGNVFVADFGNHAIRKVAPDGTTTTFAGGGEAGYANGTQTGARFSSPGGIGVDAAGNLYVADSGNDLVRKITPAGAVSTHAGTFGADGTLDGPALGAWFQDVTNLAVDPAGNVYVIDGVDHVIRVVSTSGQVTTLAGAPGLAGNTNGTGTAARFRSPGGIAVGPDGNIYVADTFNYTIRKVTPAGDVSTFAGVAGASGSTDGTGSGARFALPVGVSVGPDGAVYVADPPVGIRRITAAGVVTTIGGISGITGASDGLGASATFNGPFGVAADAAGNLYISDTGNHVIRKAGLAGVATPASRIFNLSVRGALTPGTRLIAGVVVSGSKDILIRAVGPGIASFFPPNSVAEDPRLELYDTAVQLGTNNDWGGTAALQAAFNRTGASPLPGPSSRDAALVRTLTGPNTAHMISDTAGIALVEAYDAGDGVASRLVNVSARYEVGTGANRIIAGLVIEGTGQKTVLIRGLGPALPSSIPGRLADPRLEVYNTVGMIAQNDNWNPALASAFSQVGTGALESDSRDAALLVTLAAPGLYTVHLVGTNDTTGEGLVEIFEVGN